MYNDLIDKLDKLNADLVAERRESHNELFVVREEMDALKIKLAQSSSSTTQSLAQELARVQKEREKWQEQAEQLNTQLIAERRKSHAQAKEIFAFKEELEAVKLKLTQSSSSTTQSLARDLVRLQKELDTVNDKWRRAQEEFKGRYAGWQAFKQYLAKEETKFLRDKKNCPEADHKELRRALVERRQQKLNELIPDSDYEHVEDTKSSPTIVAPSFETPKVSAPQVVTTPRTNVQPVPAQPADTEDDSQEIVPNPVPRPSTSTTTKPLGPNPRKQRHSDGFTSSRRDTSDDERPRKIRRYSSPVRAPLTTIPASGSGAAHPFRAADNRGRENRLVAQTNGENTPPARPSSRNKQLIDYSAYKGRGRYGNVHAAGDRTINASYAIDPAQNGGVDYQYDAVVRGREDRRRMQGGDCECCRDYYEAIGPLPKRLQPPLWRSPPTSPQKSVVGPRNNCRRHDHAQGEGDSREGNISSHKQAISRHRHNWARAQTPPSYWSIGFPSTQEAERINEQAETMHQQKMKAIEAEAENGGRYYRTSR